MNKINVINKILEEHNIELAGETINTEDSVFYVFVKVALDANQKQIPSSYYLNQIAKKIKEYELVAYFIHVNKDSSDLDGSLRSCIFENFSSWVRNSYLSVENQKANIWIEPKITLDTIKIKDIENLVRDYISFFNFESVHISFTQSENLPTPTAVLKTLRLLAPASLEELSDDLSRKGLTVPNIKWLNHAVDKIRKTGAIARLSNDKYILSLSGLQSLGTEKNRTSPDIRRLLALARKDR